MHYIPIQFYYRAKVKKIRLSLEADNFVLSAPAITPTNNIKSFLLETWPWLKKNTSSIKSKGIYNIPADIKSQDTIPLWGKSVRVIIKPRVDFSYNLCKAKQELKIYFPVHIFNTANSQLIHRAIHAIYYLAARQFIINFCLPKYKYKLKEQPQQIKFKKMVSQWGSCSSKGNINLNYLLAKAPSYVLEYVYVHELCHLRYRSHGKRFWRLVESLCPWYQEAEQWLKLYGQKIL